MLPIFQQLALPSILVLFTAFSIFISFPKQQISVHKKVKHTSEKVLGSSFHPTPTTFQERTNKQLGERINPTATPTSLVYGKRITPAVTSRPVQSDHLAGGTIPNISPTQVPTLQNTVVYAKSTLSASGKTILLSMQYPSQGGPISGTISGDCSGSLYGNYDGPNVGTLHGLGKATCPMGFLSIPVTISYTGKLTSSSQANISYSVDALGKTETGSTILFLTQ